MKVWFQAEECDETSFVGNPAEVAIQIVEHLARSYDGPINPEYCVAFTNTLTAIFSQQYSGAEMLGEFGIGANRIFYEIKIAEQNGDLQDLHFREPWF